MQKIKADNKYREKELINGLEISDGINPNKKLLLSSDEDHIEMSTGRTWREEYMSLLKQHGKEVTSTGGAITVNNGIKGRVISGEIKGNTKVYKRLKGTQDVWVEIPSTETRDTVTYEYKLDSTQCILNNNGSLYPVYEPTIKGTATGLAPTIVFSPVLPTLMTGDVLDLATKTITFANKSTQVLTDEQVKAYSKYKKVISLGMTSTKKDTLEIKDDGSAIYTQNTKDADDGSARIDLPAPIMTHIDKSLLPTIITQQTNTIEVGGAVKPSSFKVTVPVDRLAEIEARLQALESTTVDVVLNK